MNDKNKLKVCFCFSGQVRGDLATLENLKTELEKLSDIIEPTLIFSVWSKVGGVPGKIGYTQLNRVFEQNCVDYIPESYYPKLFNQKFPSVEKYVSSNVCITNADFRSVFSDAIVDIEDDELMDLSFKKKVDDVNSKRMLYKVWRCNEIKRKYEEKNGIFDCVVRCRADLNIQFNKTLISELTEHNKVYLVGKHVKEGALDDMFAYGSSEAMDVYCSLFHRTLTEDWDYVHRELYNLLRDNHILIEEAGCIRKFGMNTFKKFSLESLRNDNEFVSLLVGFKESLSEPHFQLKEFENTILAKLQDISDVTERYALSHFASDVFKQYDLKKSFFFFLMTSFSDVLYIDMEFSKYQSFEREMRMYFSELIGRDEGVVNSYQLSQTAQENYSHYRSSLLEETS